MTLDARRRKLEGPPRWDDMPRTAAEARQRVAAAEARGDEWLTMGGKALRVADWKAVAP